MPKAFYQWLPDRGFRRCEAVRADENEQHFSGRSLLALQAEKWDNSADLSRS